MPAALFMGALVVRNLPRQQYELAANAQRIVMWYAGRAWTLWILLILLPLIVLTTGCLALSSGGKDRFERRLAGRFVAVTTLMAGGILGVVVLHMLAN